ncbi:hypothetical protein H5410_006519 [Solanum commersonii]|uniref:Uncharacterized protein n=1 Tax=Solanum commersonii TaxID=4109 RepID=A0A9J6A9K5_SOLCO|nr:hypothetical protein H5410_006519 [Solanum commersonii]
MDFLGELTMNFILRGTQDRFVVTIVYARCSVLERLELWENLEAMAGKNFNTIVDETEKLGGFPVTQSEIHDFIQCIDGVTFMNILPESEVHHLIRRGSDHAPLYVLCNSDQVHVSGSPFTIMYVKLKRLKAVISVLSKEAFGNIFQRIATLEDVIKDKEIQFEMAPADTNR